MKERLKFIERAQAQRDEIVQYFNDIEHWNNSVRKPHEKPIDPDPDGQIAKLERALDTFLEVEKAKVLDTFKKQPTSG